MKLPLFAIASLLFLGACQQELPTDASTARQNQTDSTIEQACPPTFTGYRFLPGTLEVPVSYHMRSDRIDTDKNGQPLRRVDLEFLEGDANTTLDAVEQELLAAGYKVSPHKVQPNERIIARYTKKGESTVTVTVDPQAGEKPQNPGAKGVLTYKYSPQVVLPDGNSL